MRERIKDLKSRMKKYKIKGGESLLIKDNVGSCSRVKGEREVNVECCCWRVREEEKKR